MYGYKNLNQPLIIIQPDLFHLVFIMYSVLVFM